jgi:fatty-acyl-CoA synthase
VIGVPHEKWGEAVVAFVVPREKTAVDQAAISATLRERKGAIYVPKEFKIVDSLPLTPLGKIDKVALRAPYWEGQARKV